MYLEGAISISISPPNFRGRAVNTVRRRRRQLVSATPKETMTFFQNDNLEDETSVCFPPCLGS